MVLVAPFTPASIASMTTASTARGHDRTLAARQAPGFIRRAAGQSLGAQRLKGFRQSAVCGRAPGRPTLEVELDHHHRLRRGRPPQGHARLAWACPSRPTPSLPTTTKRLRALEVCVDAGLSVPQDVLIAGYDDIDDAARSQPALTTIRVDKERLCREAVLQLLDGRVEPGETLCRWTWSRDSTVRARTRHQRAGRWGREPFHLRLVPAIRPADGQEVVTPPRPGCSPHSQPAQTSVLACR